MRPVVRTSDRIPQAIDGTNANVSITSVCGSGSFACGQERNQQQAGQTD